MAIKRLHDNAIYTRLQRPCTIRRQDAFKLQVKTNVDARAGILVDLDGQNIEAVIEQACIHGEVEEGIFNSTSDVAAGSREVSNPAIRHVAASNFHSIEVNDRSIVAHQCQVQARIA
ncbi:hypothetical protein ES703_56480 [subsurface metagenome]